VRVAADGTIVIDSPYVENPGRADNFARQFGLTVQLRAKAPEPLLYEFRSPRVAVYEPWIPNMDQGWTEYVLDRFGIGHAVLHNDDFQGTGLRDRYDTIIFAQQSAPSILHGFRDGEMSEGQGRAGPRELSVQRPELTGGLGASGVAALERFVRDGGTLIALDTAAELPLQFFRLPVRNLVRGESGFFCPGSVLRMTLDPAHPIAHGMPKEFYAFSSGGAAFEVTLGAGYNQGDRETRAVAHFAEKNLLASGWVSGEAAVLGKAAIVEARHGQGRVILFGFRPQFRAQPHGTFKLLLNAIYLGSAQKL
jgi:hypothetical protein